jgi:protein TonB
MVIDRPIVGFSGWDPVPTRKPLSPRTLVAGGAILALHLAGAAYLYSLHIAPPLITEDPGPPAIVINPVRIKHEPRQAQQPPNVVPVHRAMDVITTTVTPLKAPPQNPTPVRVEGPPVIATTVVTPTVVPTMPPPTLGPKQIRNPTWLARPTAEQLTQFYPPRPLDEGLSGQVNLDCLVTATGQLTRCTTSGETPAGRGFAEAALKASRIFRMSPKTEDGQPVDGGTVHIPMRFAVNN